jgi:SAM-dependent methyltransferase
MAHRGWAVSGVEPDAAAAAEAAHAAGVPRESIFAGQAEDAEFADGSFDLITLTHVIEHLHDPLLVLRKARRWIAPGGRLVIWCPNIGSFESRLFGRLWFGLDVPRHLYHFTPATISRLLEQAGFSVERITAEDNASTFAMSVRNVRTREHLSGSARGLLLHGLEPLVGLLVALGDKPSMMVTVSPGQESAELRRSAIADPTRPASTHSNG